MQFLFLALISSTMAMYYNTNYQNNVPVRNFHARGHLNYNDGQAPYNQAAPQQYSGMYGGPQGMGGAGGPGMGMGGMGGPGMGGGRMGGMGGFGQGRFGGGPGGMAGPGGMGGMQGGRPF